MNYCLRPATETVTTDDDRGNTFQMTEAEFGARIDGRIFIRRDNRSDFSDANGFVAIVEVSAAFFTAINAGNAHDLGMMGRKGPCIKSTEGFYHLALCAHSTPPSLFLAFADRLICQI